MSKALIGSHADVVSLRLMDEIVSLRRRVSELEEALARAEAAAQQARVSEEAEAAVHG